MFSDFIFNVFSIFKPQRSGKGVELEQTAIRSGEEQFNSVVMSNECNAFLKQLQQVHPRKQSDGDLKHSYREPWLDVTNNIRLECFKSTMEFWSQF